MSARNVLLRTIQSNLDRPLLFTDVSERQTYRDLLGLGEAFAAACTAAGARPGDVVVLRFSRASWSAYIAAYLGCMIADLVPAITSVEKGTAAEDRLLDSLPVRLSVRAVSEPARDLADCAVAVHERAPDGGERPSAAEYLTTSGTSGKPKIVAVPGRRLLAAVRSSSRRKILAQTTPPGTNASQTALHEALFNGGAIACLSQWDPRRFIDLVERSGADTALLAPALARTLLRAPSFDPDRLHTMRALRLGMAPVPRTLLAELRSRLPRVTVTNIYTTTEAWPAGTVMRYGPMDGSTVGTPLPGTRMRIVDESGSAAPRGAVGAIQLAYAGPGSPVADWVDTGDMGRIDDAGHLVHLGRSYDMVTSGGELVSLRSVEDAALSSDAVEDACAFLLQGPSGAAVGLAVVWSGAPAEAAVRQVVADRLGQASAPRTVRSVPSLPRDTQGKLRRSAVERLALESGREAAG